MTDQLARKTVRRNGCGFGVYMCVCVYVRVCARVHGVRLCALYVCGDHVKCGKARRQNIT